MRIIAGEFRGRKLIAPVKVTRPTTGKVREAVFSTLQAKVPGSAWLDLFAGSGAVGIEALSRGARYCWFVDNSPAAARAIRENLHNLGLVSRATVMLADAVGACRTLAAQRGRAFDIVYVDPPYREQRKYQLVLEQVRHLLAPGGVVVVEHQPEMRWQLALPVIKSRTYGSSAVTYFAGEDD